MWDGTTVYPSVQQIHGAAAGGNASDSLCSIACFATEFLWTLDAAIVMDEPTKLKMPATESATRPRRVEKAKSGTQAARRSRDKHYDDAGTTKRVISATNFQVQHAARDLNPYASNLITRVLGRQPGKSERSRRSRLA